MRLHRLEMSAFLAFGGVADRAGPVQFRPAGPGGLAAPDQGGSADNQEPGPGVLKPDLLEVALAQLLIERADLVLELFVARLGVQALLERGERRGFQRIVLLGTQVLEHERVE